MARKMSLPKEKSGKSHTSIFNKLFPSHSSSRSLDSEFENSNTARKLMTNDFEKQPPNILSFFSYKKKLYLIYIYTR